MWLESVIGSHLAVRVFRWVTRFSSLHRTDTPNSMQLTQDRELHANQLSRLKAEVASSGILVKNCEYDHEHKKEDEKKISVDMPLTTLQSNFNFSSSEYINI